MHVHAYPHSWLPSTTETPIQARDTVYDVIGMCTRELAVVLSIIFRIQVANMQGQIDKGVRSTLLLRAVKA